MIRAPIPSVIKWSKYAVIVTSISSNFCGSAFFPSLYSHQIVTSTKALIVSSSLHLLIWDFLEDKPENDLCLPSNDDVRLTHASTSSSLRGVSYCRYGSPFSVPVPVVSTSSGKSKRSLFQANLTASSSFWGVVRVLNFRSAKTKRSRSFFGLASH